MEMRQLVRISVNGGAREVRVEPGGSLLSRLVAEGVYLPSGCGGQGLCGLCRVRLEDGEAAAAGPLTEAEARLLPEEARRGGVRLACQLSVERELSIRIPAALERVRAFRAEVASVRALTADIRLFVLELLDPPSMEFEAGAYVQLTLPPLAGRADLVFRAYSISSPSSARRAVELIVRRVPGGVCSEWIFEHLGPGARCTLVGPFGDLSLRESDRDLLFVAHGSGMAPIRGILRDMAERQVRRRARLLFGARVRADLFLLEEMEELERSLPGFRFVPVLSNPGPGDSWAGERGRLTEAIARLPGSLEGVDAYLSGSPGIVEACLRALASRGLPEGHAYYDTFP